MVDPIDEIRQKIDARNHQYSGEILRSETQWIDLAAAVLALWDAWWRDPQALSDLQIEARLESKFLMCFALAAHAMNHIEIALQSRPKFPWVARTSGRVAFEHSLTAQWVLLTADGERKLKAGFGTCQPE